MNHPNDSKAIKRTLLKIYLSITLVFPAKSTILLGFPFFWPSYRMNSTASPIEESMSSKEVMYSSPLLLTDVVTRGIPDSDTIWLIQWFGILTPMVLKPGFTFFDTHFLFLTLRIKV